MTDVTTQMGEVGEIWRLSHTILRVLAPNPSPMTGPGTNTYVVGEGPVIVIDPGPDIDEHKKTVLAAIDGRQVLSILVTHHHLDHWPLAPTLGRDVGAPVLAHGPIGNFSPDRRLPAGGMQIVPGARLRAVHTPGHASDHLCFYLEEEDALFAGDHVLANTTSVIAPPDGSMEAYMASLELIKKLDLERIYPGHGPVIVDPLPWIDYYVSHRREREQAVLEAVFAGVAEIPGMVTRIYTDVPEELHPVARFSVLAHLIKLMRDRKVTVPEEYLLEDLESAKDATVEGTPDAPDLPLGEPPLMTATFVPVTGA